MNVYNRYEDEHFESEEESLYWEQISWLETSISGWVENEIESGNVPEFENFLDEYPEWDHDELYDTIITFLTRFIKMHDDEKQWDSLPF